MNLNIRNYYYRSGTVAMKFAKVLFTVYFSIFLLLGMMPSALSQDVAPGPTVIVYGTKEDANTKVPPPPVQKLPRRHGQYFLRGGQSQFEVDYHGFTNEAKEAFRYAVKIWASQIISPVTIRIDARFIDLGGTNSAGNIILGGAGSNGIRRVQGKWCAQALADKLEGRDLGNGAADIITKFNSHSDANWYFGTDRNTPSGQTDFVTTVLHELGHGLGFAGLGKPVSDRIGIVRTGTVRRGDYPGIYDSFVENGAGTDLTTFPDPSAALLAQLTGGNLFWNGTKGVAANGGTRPKLYAPNSWKRGTSYSHLDEDEFGGAGNLNSLMTPSIGTAEAIHNPGPITLGMFEDMGWTINSSPQVVPSCMYTLSPSSQDVPTAGRSFWVSVTTATGCDWTATSNNDFLSVTPLSGTGNGIVTVTVNQNTGGARTGTLTIAGQRFTVTQASQSTPVTQADLAIQSLQVSKNTLTTGESFTLSATIHNNGPGNSVSVDISYYYSFILGPSTDDRVERQRTVTVNPIASSESITKSIRLDAPSTAGTYYYGAWLAGATNDPNINNDLANEVRVTVSSPTPNPPSSVCDRTPQVRDEIVRVSPVFGNCAKVTEDHLDSITRLSLDGGDITTLQPGDFDELWYLERLDLAENDLRTLPAGIFQDLTELTELYLDNNQLTSLEARIFAKFFSLEKLYLDGNQLTTLRRRVFDNLDNLIELYLDGNQLTTLEAEVFEDLSNLTYLYLDENQLTTLPVGVFNGLNSLIELDLEDNRITTLSTDVFKGLDSLEDLYLDGNPLTTIKTGAFNGLNFTQLDLDGYSLKTIEVGAFNGLANLIELDLRDNQLTTLPVGVFSGLNSLIELDLRDNQLTTLPTDVFKGLDSLEDLYLDGNPLTTIKTGAFNGLNFTQLDLGDYSLKTIEAGAFNGLDRLTRLDLDGNQLTTLSTGIFNGLSSLTRLYLEGNPLTTIETDAFNGLNSLTDLYLDDYSLTTIEVGAFNGLDNLIELDLDGNQLTTLPVGVFNGLNSLEELYLCENQLTTLPVGIFNGLDSLEYLDLEDNRITTLPTDGFKGLTSLEDLDLDGNPLTTIETGAFNGLNNFTELDLYGYSLTTIEVGAFSGLDNLTELVLDENQLKTLPADVFKGLASLEYLTLTGNQFTVLRVGVFNGLNNLTELGLGENQLTTLPVGVFNGLNNLTELGLGENQLTTLPVGVFNGLNNLTELGLGENQLTTLPIGVFNGLNSLNNLDLYENQLTILPAGIFSDLSSLTRLGLDNNRLTTLPAGAFEGLISLSTLNLYKNQLTTLPAGVFDGLNINQLVLSENSLTTLPVGTFRRLSRVTRLTLEMNQLTTLPAGIFSDLSSLTELELYNNQLTTLPVGVFNGLNSLEDLDLYENQLTTLPVGVFNGLNNLTQLALYDNQLTTLPAGIFNGLNKLRTLHLFKNQFTTLLAGMFEGLSSLRYLDLRDNPGTPFTLTLELVRTDNTDLAAPGPATVAVKLAQGAPFEMTVSLSVQGGTLSATTATITRGKTQSDPITVTQSGNGSTTVRLGPAPTVPSGYYGIQMAVDDPLLPFDPGSIPEKTLVKISGDNQQGAPGAALASPFIVEARDAANSGVQGIDVTFAVTVGGGTLSETTVTTNADGRAQTTLTLGTQPGTNTVSASIAGISESVSFNAVAGLVLTSPTPTSAQRSKPLSTNNQGTQSPRRRWQL